VSDRRGSARPFDGKRRSRSQCGRTPGIYGTGGGSLRLGTPQNVEGPPGRPKRSFKACRSSTLRAIVEPLRRGAYLPAVIQLGNPCSSAHLARGPPNRRDDISHRCKHRDYVPLLRCEQEIAKPCPRYSTYSQAQRNCACCTAQAFVGIAVFKAVEMMCS
jgi:hypothetical protein